MSGNIDQELLRGFVVQAKSYLPEILRGLTEYWDNPQLGGPLTDAQARVRTIKGASAMLGRTDLSRLAAQVEESIGGISLATTAFDAPTLDELGDLIARMTGLLDDMLPANLTEPPVTRPLTMPPLAQPKPSVNGGREKLTIVPPPKIEPEPAPPASNYAADIPEELLEVFIQEAEEHLRTLTLSLPEFAERSDNRAVLQEIRRSAHSLKGSAGMVGFSEMSRLAHRSEDLLDLLYDGEMTVTPAILQLLFESTDALEDLLYDRANERTLHALYGAYDQLLGGSRSEPLPPPPLMEAVSRPTGPLSPPKMVAVESPPPEAQSAGTQSRANFVRVPIEKLDEVVNLVTELIINRAAFEQNMTNLNRQLEELRGSSARLSRVASKMEVQYEASTLGGGLSLRKAFTGGNGLAVAVANPVINSRTPEFDDLELDRYTEFHLLLRGLTEAAGDVQTLDRELNLIRDYFDSCLNRNNRLSSDLQDRLMRLRMEPLATLATRLHRTARNVATQRGKQVKFFIEGEETRLDKTVIEDLADPLLHLLRNAIDHGLETAARRLERGKPETGTVCLRAFHEGTQTVIQLIDNGRGIDPEALRQAAVEKGYVSAADAAKLSEQDLFSLLFLPGFSTAPEVSEISGRGVGLDVVKVTIHRLKGSVTVDSKLGEGTVFTIRLPMTLAVMRALMVNSCKQPFAIPIAGLHRIVRLTPQMVERIGQEEVIRFDGKIYPLLSLARLLNLKAPDEQTGKPRSALLMNIEDRHVAITVDQTIGGREIVVKNLGNHLLRVHGIIGATLLGDGSPVLILNLPELIRDAFRPQGRTPVERARAVAHARKALTVLVVDDSVSVRRVLSNMLSGVGWQPVQAKDGLDALEILNNLPAKPDIVLADIEMPRMDGYEFISTLRKEKGYGDLPVVVITSRAGQKHRDKAFEVGATEYLVKPYQDDTLVGLIRRLVEQAAE